MAALSVDTLVRPLCSNARSRANKRRLPRWTVRSGSSKFYPHPARFYWSSIAPEAGAQKAVADNKPPKPVKQPAGEAPREIAAKSQSSTQPLG